MNLDPNILEQVNKYWPEYSPERHAQMIANIDPSLLNRDLYVKGLVEEAKGVVVRGDGELGMRKKLKNFHPHTKTTTLSPEQEKKNEEYFKQVKNPSLTTSSKPPTPLSLLMDEDKAKREVWELVKEELGATKPIIDKYTKNILRDVTRYFIYHPSSPLCLEKGLFIFGGCGVGKSMLFRVFSKFTHHHQLPNRFTILKTSTLIRDVIDDKKWDRITQATYSSKLIDDLGEEADLVGWYEGENKAVKIVRRVLTERYEKFIKSGQITHISTNLTPGPNEVGEDRLKRLYGERVVSRFKEMFNIVFWEGLDKRGFLDKMYQAIK